MPAAKPSTLLAFERRWPTHSSERDARIRDELGITPVRYAVLLLRAASSPDGIAVHPMTARLVRERAARRASMREARTGPGRFANLSDQRAIHKVQDTVQTPEGPTQRSA